MKLRALILLVSVLLLPTGARAEARIALLIGNQGYNAKVGPLTNPHNDIALLAAALERVGFKTTLLKDADYRSIDAAIKRHVASVRREGQGAISFVYYSGHGAADPDTKLNYLIPVDVANADDEDLWNYSLNLNSIVEGLRAQAPEATHYVVFDACRNELKLTRIGKKALADKGFVPIAYTPGVMVAYATAPGKTADDRGSEGGPYAKALAEEIVKPGVEALTMFRRVVLKVNREIGQDPWMSASTLPEVYFAGEATPKQAPACDGASARVANEPRCLRPREVFKDCPKCPEMVVVAPGRFKMGGLNEEQRLLHPGSDHPDHDIAIATIFAVGQYAVTRDQFSEFIDDTKHSIAGGCSGWTDKGPIVEPDRSVLSPGFEQTGNHPVVCVSWDEARQYVAWLSTKTGGTYRLLSEAEREFVTRAGTTTPFWWGNYISANQANYLSSVSYKGGATTPPRWTTVPVDFFGPNPWGLFQMHGNVQEWVGDCWHPNYVGAPSDGASWMTDAEGDCAKHVIRGGSFVNHPALLQSGTRNYGEVRDRVVGFRVARTL